MLLISNFPLMKLLSPVIRKFIFWLKLTLTLTSSSLIASAESTVENESVILSIVEDINDFIIE